MTKRFFSLIWLWSWGAEKLRGWGAEKVRSWGLCSGPDWSLQSGWWMWEEVGPSRKLLLLVANSSSGATSGSNPAAAAARQQVQCAPPQSGLQVSPCSTATESTTMFSSRCESERLAGGATQEAAPLTLSLSRCRCWTKKTAQKKKNKEERKTKKKKKWRRRRGEEDSMGAPRSLRLLLGGKWKIK